MMMMRATPSRTEISMKEKQNEPVMAEFIRVLEDNPKGVSQAKLNKIIGSEYGGKILNQEFKIPQGPMRIGSQWW